MARHSRVYLYGQRTYCPLLACNNRTDRRKRFLCHAKFRLPHAIATIDLTFCTCYCLSRDLIWSSLSMQCCDLRGLVLLPVQSTYPRAGQTPFHQRHHPLSGASKRQTRLHRPFSPPYQEGCRNRKRSDPHHRGLALLRRHRRRDQWECKRHLYQAAIPIRYRRRAGQPHRDPISYPQAVPLHVFDSSPSVQYSVILPLHYPSARQDHRLLQLHALRSWL